MRRLFNNELVWGFDPPPPVKYSKTSHLGYHRGIDLGRHGLERAGSRWLVVIHAGVEGWVGGWI
jgi:hypothetical protein